MRICHGFDGFFHYRRGGAERWWYEIGKVLQERGHEIYLTSRYHGEDQPAEETVEGLNVVSYGAPADATGTMAGVKNRLSYAKALADIDADVYVNTCYTHLTGITALVAKMKGRPFVYAATNDHEYSSEWRNALPLNRKLSGWTGMRLADRYIAYSQETYDAALETFPGPEERFDWFYHGHPKQDVDLDEKEKKVVWMASFKDWKRPDLFLEIADQVEAEDWEFCLIGYGPDEKEEWVQSMCDDIDNARFLGPTENDWEWFKKASLFVNTSEEGEAGFANTFIQSWICGTPVVSQHSDQDNLIRDNDIGYRSSDIDELADWIEEVINDPDRLRELQENALEFGDRFDVEKTADRYEAIFEELVDGQ